MKIFKKILRLTAKILLGIFLVTILWAVVYKWVNPPFTFIMLERKIEASAKKKSTVINYNWVDYEDMSYYMPLAVIAAEDQNFSTHHGFDIIAIQKAMEHNKRHKRIRGASTISQQVAKNAFLWSGKSWLRKGMEVYFTCLIEVIWGKKRIVEVYVNIAEMGPMTFGAGAASRRFFNTPPNRITMGQAALLAAVLPNPKRFSARYPSGYILNRQSWIMEQMNQLGGWQYLKEME